MQETHVDLSASPSEMLFFINPLLAATVPYRKHPGKKKPARKGAKKAAKKGGAKKSGGKKK